MLFLWGTLYLLPLRGVRAPEDNAQKTNVMTSGDFTTLLLRSALELLSGRALPAFALLRRAYAEFRAP